jgi:hypothetical protein
MNPSMVHSQPQSSRNQFWRGHHGISISPLKSSRFTFADTRAINSGRRRSDSTIPHVVFMSCYDAPTHQCSRTPS